jgi:hypothetical protein
MSKLERVLATVIVIALALTSIPLNAGASQGGDSSETLLNGQDASAKTGNSESKSVTTGTVYPPYGTWGIDVSLHSMPESYDIGPEKYDESATAFAGRFDVYTNSRYLAHEQPLHFVSAGTAAYGTSWSDVRFLWGDRDEVNPTTLLTQGGGGVDNKWGEIVTKHKKAESGKKQLTPDLIKSWITTDSAEGRTYEQDKTMLAALLGTFSPGGSSLMLNMRQFVKEDDPDGEVKTAYYAGFIINLARVAYRYDSKAYGQWEPMLDAFFEAITHEKEDAYRRYFPLLVTLETTTHFRNKDSGQEYMATVQGMVNYELGGTGLHTIQTHEDKTEFEPLYDLAHTAAGSCLSCQGGGLVMLSSVYNGNQIHVPGSGGYYVYRNAPQGITCYNTALFTDSGLYGQGVVGHILPTINDPSGEGGTVYLSGRSGITVNPKAKLVAGNPFTENTEIEIEMVQHERDKGNWDAFFRYLEEINYTGPIGLRIYLKGDEGEDPSANLADSGDVTPAGSNPVPLSPDGGPFNYIPIEEVKKLIEGDTSFKYIHAIKNGNAPVKWTYAQGVQIKVDGVEFINVNDENNPTGPDDDMMLRQEPRTDFASFIIGEDIHYYSKVSTPYAEIKAGRLTDGGSVEDFNAMTGTPTTETLFFASGGSEFVVQMDGEFVQNRTYTRTYTVTYSPVSCSESNHPAGGDPDPMNAPCADTGDSTSWTQKFTGLNYVKFRNLKLWQLTESGVGNMRRLVPAGTDTVKGSIERPGFHSPRRQHKCYRVGRDIGAVME